MHNGRAAPTTSFYIDQFIHAKCAAALLRDKIFPDTKEITESMAAFSAIKKYFGTDRFADGSIVALDIACGKTPRTSCLLAHMTRWNVHAVDPNLNDKKSYRTERLTLHRDKIQDLHFAANIVVMTAVHPHVKTPEIIANIEAKELFLVSIECCVPQTLDIAPTWEYQDQHCWSPARTVRIWHWRKP